jgi:hypothetical protein
MNELEKAALDDPFGGRSGRLRATAVNISSDISELEKN